jgi:Mrp family chromosome partitioning ATPase
MGIDEAAVPTRVEGLLLLPAGPVPDNPIRLLRSEQMEEFVSQVSSLADFVVFDSPAGAAFADASLLAAVVKNVVIVHSAGRVPRGAESEFRSKLDMVGANILGTVLNKVRPEDSHGYYHFRRFYEGLGAEQRPAVGAGIRAIPGSTEGSDGES